MTTWLSNYLPQGNQVRNQYYLTWTSFFMGMIAATYLYMNTHAFYQYPLILGTGFFIYFAGITFAILHIQTQAVAPWRVAGIIGLDIILIFSLMWLDGNITSHFYVLFFPILILSLYWFGLAFLLLSFASICIGLSITVIFLLPIHDVEEFIIHMITLMLIPFVAWIMHKQAQPASHLHQNFLSLLDQSPLAIITYQLTQQVPNIRFANHAACNLLNEELHQLSGKALAQITIIKDSDEMTKQCLEALQKTKHTQGQTFFVRAHNQHGKTIQIMCVAYTLVWQGESIGACFLVDISQTEKLRHDMNHSMQQGYMSTLVAGIVHDFRNVLTNIIGTAEVLAFTSDNETAKKQIQRIIQAGEQGSETITQLLQLSKTQNQRTGILASDMQKVFANITDLLRIQLPQHIQLHCKIENSIPSIALSISELEQILMNLVNNATQAIKNKGEINIHVSLKTIADHQENIPAVKVSVSDNGCGIAKKDLPYITKNFWTSRQDEGGTGLGLAMVKHIVTQHTGKMNLASTQGIGTTIDIYIPQDLGNTLPHSLRKKHQHSQHKPCCILLVDDSIEILEVHNMLLESMGHTIHMAQSAQEALLIAQSENIDLLITDLKMPGMNGTELATILQKQTPNLPVLIISAYDEITQDKGIQTLAVSVLLKPGTFLKLSEAIHKIQQENPQFFS